MAAQAATEAVKEFADTSANRQLKTIQFVHDSLLSADTFTTVLRNLLVDSSNDQPSITNKTENNKPATSEWYEIDHIIKRQKRAGKDMFLVKWKGTDDESWVRRKDLSPAALQHFYANHPKRRRRRTP